MYLVIYNLFDLIYHFQDIFYSRKNFLRPDLQDDRHKAFEKEVEWLDGIFDCESKFTGCLCIFNMMHLCTHMFHFWFLVLTNELMQSGWHICKCVCMCDLTRPHLTFVNIFFYVWIGLVKPKWQLIKNSSKLVSSKL